MDLEFFLVDDPDLAQHKFTREGLVRAESHLLDRHQDKRSAFSDVHLTITMRYVYFIGETFRRATEGRWVALPPDPPQRGPASAIDAEFTPAFYVPQDYLGVALTRRTGKEITFVYDIAVRKHEEWVASGRKPSTGR
ncbi:hypothetical protein [Rhodococcoides yunnanense]|uniref:hypothetical protein n=1 Tax=Rhodococcoides yunnanense TaxID=278209 RepID=UPI001114B121|nr:hypothetical protein [Rhodococcus yunnanensis]